MTLSRALKFSNTENLVEEYTDDEVLQILAGTAIPHTNECARRNSITPFLLNQYEKLMLHAANIFDDIQSVVSVNEESRQSVADILSFFCSNLLCIDGDQIITKDISVQAFSASKVSIHKMLGTIAFSPFVFRNGQLYRERSIVTKPQHGFVVGTVMCTLYDAADADSIAADIPNIGIIDEVYSLSKYRITHTGIITLPSITGNGPAYIDEFGVVTANGAGPTVGYIAGSTVILTDIHRLHISQTSVLHTQNIGITATGHITDDSASTETTGHWKLPIPTAGIINIADVDECRSSNILGIVTYYGDGTSTTFNAAHGTHTTNTEAAITDLVFVDGIQCVMASVLDSIDIPNQETYAADKTKQYRVRRNSASSSDVIFTTAPSAGSVITFVKVSARLRCFKQNELGKATIKSHTIAFEHFKPTSAFYQADAYVINNEPLYADLIADSAEFISMYGEHHG